MKTFNKRILGGHFVAWDLRFGASRLHSGPKCGRYMYMTSKIVILTLALIVSSFSHSCVVPKYIEDGSVTITPDKDIESGMYHVRVPVKYKNAKLEFLVLTASTDNKNEISVPLSIKSKDGITGSHFHMSSKWVNIRVSASYEGIKCTDLVVNLNM